MMTALYLFLQIHGGDILQAVTSIVTGASVLANFTPTDKDNKALGWVGKMINMLAANFFTLKPDTSKPTYNK